jgi:opacity protein-like surface antigen
MRNVVRYSLALAALVASHAAQAQRTQPSARFSRSTTLAAQQGAANRPSARLFGGIATGDNNLDLGFTGGVSFTWDLAGVPVDFRFDPSLSRYTGDPAPGADWSLLTINLPAAAEYVFPTSGTGSARYYVMGGVGLYYMNWSFDNNNVPGGDASDSGLEMGITLGGGVRLNDKLGFEGRIVDVGGFTTIPLLVTWKIK